MTLQSSEQTTSQAYGKPSPEPVGYVYHTTVYSEKSGKTYHYVGKREKKNFSHAYKGSGKALKAVIEKCGTHNALVEPIAWATTRQELEAIEISFIAKCKSSYKSMCLNRHEGGNGGSMPVESVQKAKLTRIAKDDIDPIGRAIRLERMRLAKIGKKMTDEAKKKRLETRSKKQYIAWNRGIPMSDDAKSKASKSLTGKPGPNLGKVFSDEVRQKLSAARKGKTFSDAHKQSMRVSCNKSKPVKNILTGEIFSSLMFACQSLGLSYSSAKKKRKSGTLYAINLVDVKNV